MTLPTFCIIGAAKAGTTSLYEYLNQHPQIYMSPVKEPRFFGRIGEPPDYRGPSDEATNQILITEEADYRALFANVNDSHLAYGEASPWYLYMERAAAQLYEWVPNIKLIAILRNPVDRAYSNFVQQRSSRAEPLADFEAALAAENLRIQDNWRPFWHYQALGFYDRQLSRYWEYFSRSQLRVYLYEDLRNSPNWLLRDIFEFLEVDPNVAIDYSKQYNVTYYPPNALLHSLLKDANPCKSVIKNLLPGSAVQTIKDKLYRSSKPTFPPTLRRQLTLAYREDILRLQDRIGRDLSTWLAIPST